MYFAFAIHLQVSGSGARALWETACRAAQYKRAELSRKDIGQLFGQPAAEISIVENSDTRPASPDDTESITPSASHSKSVPEPAPYVFSRFHHICTGTGVHFDTAEQASRMQTGADASHGSR